MLGLGGGRTTRALLIRGNTLYEHMNDSMHRYVLFSVGRHRRLDFSISRRQDRRDADIYV